MSLINLKTGVKRQCTSSLLQADVFNMTIYSPQRVESLSDVFYLFRSRIVTFIFPQCFCYSLSIHFDCRAVADPGGGQRGHAPPPSRKIGKKRWPPNAAAYISCFLAPLSEVSGSATAARVQYVVVYFALLQQFAINTNTSNESIYYYLVYI